MTTLATAEVVIGGSDKQLREALSGAENRMKAAGKKMSRIGRTLSMAVTLPLAGIGAASVKMASDAEEAANKFNVVMGESTGAVRSQLQELQKTIPLTSAEMEAMASGIQDMLVPMGLARAEAAGMSADMVQLAGDLASFNNVPTTRVLEAMQSALAGQSEPMRRFGVDTRVTRLETLALTEGIIEQGEELDNTSRALAVMAAIQADSSDAMGDAARTADSTANLMRFLARDVKQLGINIGQVLIPAVRPMLKQLSEWTESLNDLNPDTIKLALGIGAVAAAAGPAAIVLGNLTIAVSGLATATTFLFAALGPAGWLVLGLGAAASGFAAGKAKAALFGDQLDTLSGQLERGREQMDALEASLLRQFGDADESISAPEPPESPEPPSVDSTVPEILSRVNDELQEANRLSAALGPHFDQSAQAAKILEQGIRDLVAEGMSPANQQIIGMRRRITALTADWQALAPTIMMAGQTGTQALIGMNQKLEGGRIKVRRFGEGINRAGEIGKAAARLIQDSFSNAFGALIAGTKSFGEAFAQLAKNILTQLAQMITQALVFATIMAIVPGGSALGFGALFKKGLGIPGLAHGGPVHANQPAIVGEEGPELFVPSSAGQVVSNQNMGGGAGSVASEILSRVGPPPGNTPPSTVATDRWWRDVFSRLSEDHQERRS